MKINLKIRKKVQDIINLRKQYAIKEFKKRKSYIGTTYTGCQSITKKEAIHQLREYYSPGTLTEIYYLCQVKKLQKYVEKKLLLWIFFGEKHFARMKRK